MFDLVFRNPYFPTNLNDFMQLCGHIGGRVDAAVRCKRRRAAVGAAATSKQREEASKRACGIGAADLNAGAGVSI